MAAAQPVCRALEGGQDCLVPQGAIKTTLKVVPGSSALDLNSLYKQHALAVTRYLAGKLQSQEDAEDIVQQAFIRIKPKLDGHAVNNPVAYLYQVANNLAIDFLRHKKIQRNFVDVELDRQSMLEGEADHDCCTPERVLAGKTNIAKVEAALNNMPENCRHAFLLHRVKGYTYSDIAQEKNVSISSVEKYILLALKQCRRAIDLT